MDDQQIWQSIKLGRYDRGVLVGKTGSGKTTLARFLIEDDAKRYSVTWNPKGSDNVYKWDQKHITSLTELKDADIRKYPRLIYTPSPLLAEDENDQYSFFYWIYERKYTRLYIDEATAIVYNGNRPPRYLTAVLNRGRERGISSLTATQRPAGVPANILSESEHYYVFQTSLPQDKQRIEQITGITVEDQFDLNEFEFFYFNLNRGLFPTKLKLNLNGASNYAKRESAIAPISRGK